MFYNEAGEPAGWTGPKAPRSESADGLIRVLEMMLMDAKRIKDDILDYTNEEHA